MTDQKRKANAAKAKRYRDKNKAKVAALNKAWHEKNRDRVKFRIDEPTRLRRQAKSNEFRRNATATNSVSHQKMRQTSREYDKRIKLEVIEAYGGKCRHCGETEPEFLTLDHVNDDGNAHRTKTGNRAKWKWAKTNGFPDLFQLLCMCCNMAKNKVITQSRLTQRFTVMNGYGGKCQCCSEDKLERLVLDHVNQDGAEHRKTIKGGLYAWAIKNDFPPVLRCLCANCNQSAAMGGGVCVHKRV